MKPSFYSGASGLLAHQQNLNTIGNNIANVNTNGYKSQSTTFEDLLYNKMYVNTKTNPLSGQGVKATNAGLNFNQGNPRQTLFEFDFAIAGDALFAIEKNGERTYTRDGEFAINLEGDRAFLGTQDGGSVLDNAGQRIELQKMPKKDSYNTDALVTQIGLHRFNNPGALTPLSGNRYVPTEASGEAQLVTDNSSKLLKGYIENSATNLPDEMANMIAAQRAYQVSARVLQVSDENEQTINSLRR